MGIFGGVTLCQTKNVIFSHPISDLEEAQNAAYICMFIYSEIMSSLLRLERKQKRLLEIHFEFSYNSFFLPVVPSKTTPDSRLKRAKYKRVPTETAQKPYPLGSRRTHTYMAYIRE